MIGNDQLRQGIAACAATCPDRPVVRIASDLHTAWANTRALEMASPLHSASLPTGNEVVLGAGEKATGE